MPDGEQAPEIHVRSSRPVSSRNRSSRLRGRICSVPQRHAAVEQGPQRALDVGGRDLDTVARDQNRQREIRCLAAEVLARQLEHHVVEMLLQQPRRRALGDDAAA